MTAAVPLKVGALTLAEVRRAIVWDLENNVERYKDDPLGFVLDWFTWPDGEGPDEWQIEFLSDLAQILRSRKFNGRDPVEPVKMAVASGHGIGKGALTAWLHWWIMVTRKNAKGTVTANTFPQLQTKTWAEIKKWHKRLIAFRNRFRVLDTKCFEKENPETWFSVPYTCAEENFEAFQGQHNRESTSFFLLDEASNIPDVIFQKSYQGMTDGEPMLFAMGNPTRNTGEFYEACFGKLMHRWNSRSIDARTCKFPNKEEQNKLIEDEGIDSDRVRVEILGLPPHQSELQLISKQVVDEAQKRPMQALPGDPLIAGVDVPDGGAAWFIVRFRRGLDSRPGPLIPHPFRVAGSKITREMMIAKLAQIMMDPDPKHRPAAMFIDAAFGSPLVERLHALGQKKVFEISFGEQSPEPQRFANMRAYMWGGQMKDWLRRGAIDPSDKKLAVDLTAPGFHHRVGGDGALVIESKADMAKRHQPSPDDGDALALTFARPVAPTPPPIQPLPMRRRSQYDWMA